jgi:uncharacterized DUF497 family protein
MFEWDLNNIGKIRAHRITQEEAEQALLNNPIPVYEQEVEGEIRFVYYGETNAGRLLAVVVTERAGKLRVVTAYWTPGSGGNTTRGARRQSEP